MACHTCFSFKESEKPPNNMIDSTKAPKTTSATVQGKLVCKNGHNMHIEGTGSSNVTAVCYDKSCELYRIKYAVAYPTAVLTKKDIQDGQDVK